MCGPAYWTLTAGSFALLLGFSAGEREGTEAEAIYVAV